MATTAAMAAIAGPAREIRHELGLPRRGIREVLSGQPDPRRWPVFHGFSPVVVPRPADWPDGYEVAGYWWPQRPPVWSPPAELEEFLASGPPPVFFGFGDVTPDDTCGFIELAADAGREAGVRQVIQAGQTGQHPSRRPPPSDSIVIGDLPHDWLFPRMAAVVHHAGAGTTAAGLRAGVPSVTVPVLADQPFWAARLATLGVGPAPIPRRQLSVAALAAAVRDAVALPSYRTQAQALSRRLASEDGAAPIMSWLARLGGSRPACAASRPGPAELRLLQRPLTRTGSGTTSSRTWLDRGGAERDRWNGWTSPQMLTRYAASARGARARRSYDRIMDDTP